MAAEHILQICTGTACYAKGGGKLYDYAVANKPDNFDVVASRCLGACGLAPVVMLDDETYPNCTTADIANIYAVYGSNGDEPDPNKIATVADCRSISSTAFKDKSSTTSFEHTYTGTTSGSVTVSNTTNISQNSAQTVNLFGRQINRIGYITIPSSSSAFNKIKITFTYGGNFNSTPEIYDYTTHGGTLLFGVSKSASVSSSSQFIGSYAIYGIPWQKDGTYWYTGGTGITTTFTIDANSTGTYYFYLCDESNVIVNPVDKNHNSIYGTMSTYTTLNFTTIKIEAGNETIYPAITYDPTQAVTNKVAKAEGSFVVADEYNYESNQCIQYKDILFSSQKSAIKLQGWIDTLTTEEKNNLYGDYNNTSRSYTINASMTENPDYGDESIVVDTTSLSLYTTTSSSQLSSIGETETTDSYYDVNISITIPATYYTSTSISRRSITFPIYINGVEYQMNKPYVSASTSTNANYKRYFSTSTIYGTFTVPGVRAKQYSTSSPSYALYDIQFGKPKVSF